MFKTISAALLAISVLASPAFAATAKTATHSPVIKAAPVKASVLNANAKMGKHHQQHVGHHRQHNRKLAGKGTHHAKVSFKHVPPTTTKHG